jgi:hypothetical protein
MWHLISSPHTQNTQPALSKSLFKERCFDSEHALLEILCRNKGYLGVDYVPNASFQKFYLPIQTLTKLLFLCAYVLK